MSDPSVADLREQLRERGYLTHRMERWFALDPWSSRTFWTELLTVSAKAGVLTAPFAAIAHVTVMLFRNGPLSPLAVMELFLLYATGWMLVSGGLVMILAGTLKLRPELAVDRPGALLALSIAAATAPIVLFGSWWYGFTPAPRPLELMAGLAGAVLLFLVASIVFSAALLSFSIHELHRIPALHQKPRTIPLAIAAAVLMVLLFVPAQAMQQRDPAAPPQIATAPSRSRVALIAVDGLSYEILSSRPDLIGQFTHSQRVQNLSAASTAERWASIGTGVPAPTHGVRAVAGVTLLGTNRVLQSLSSFDFMVRSLAPALGLARQQPLPPTTRRRHYVWEILGQRAVPSLAVNWWASEERSEGALSSIGQPSIFAAAKGDPLSIDGTAGARALASMRTAQPRLIAIYLPALDVILNRAAGHRSAQLALSLRALDGIAALVRRLRHEGYEIILAGAPGDGQQGEAVIATTVALAPARSLLDIAPTILTLHGFPLSEEMPGQSLAPREAEPRIASYGARHSGETSSKLDREYYESLRSLGYIR